MKSCRYTTFECHSPHLKCEACDEYREFLGASKGLLSPRGSILPALPDPRPYMRVVDVAGRKGIEIGIKGTL